MGFCPYVDPLRASSVSPKKREEQARYRNTTPGTNTGHYCHTMDAASQGSRRILKGELQHYPIVRSGSCCVEKVELGGDYYQNPFCGRIRQVTNYTKSRSPEVIQNFIKILNFSLKALLIPYNYIRKCKTYDKRYSNIISRKNILK